MQDNKKAGGAKKGGKKEVKLPPPKQLSIVDALKESLSVRIRKEVCSGTFSSCKQNRRKSIAGDNQKKKRNDSDDDDEDVPKLVCVT